MEMKNFQWRPWKESEVVVRDMDEAETFYASVSKLYQPLQKTVFGVTAHASIFVPQDGTQNLEAVLGAAFAASWTHILKKHPTLLSDVRLGTDGKTLKRFCSLCPKASTLKEHAMQTVDEGISGAAFHDLDMPFNDHAAFYLVVPPVGDDHETVLRRDIVLRIQHDRIDGMGALMLLGKLISLASESMFGGAEVSDVSTPILAPSLREAARIPVTPSAEQMAKWEAVKLSNGVASSDQAGKKVAAIQYNEASKVPGRSLRSFMNFSAADTEMIVRACRILKTTPTAAFHAGIAVHCASQVKTKTSVARYISYALINLRSICEPPYNTSEYFSGTYHCISANSLVVDIQITEDEGRVVDSMTRFSSALAQSASYYRSLSLDPDYLSMIPSIFSPKTPAYDPSPSSIPAANPTPSISLSSMGIVDRIISPSYGALQVQRPWIAGAEYGTGVGCFLSTFDGRMELSALWNEAYHTDTEIVALLGEVAELVKDGLLGCAAE